MFLVGLAAVGVVGFVPWRVTGWVQRFLNGSPRRAGWLFSVEQARWTPWSHLELDHLRIQTPGGGKLHLVKAEGMLHPSALLRGSVRTEWNLGEIRMDPGSWKIRAALAQEILSVTPVTTNGSVLLCLGQREIELEDFSLTGPVLWVKGQALFRTRENIHLHLKGGLSRTMLEAMQFVSRRTESGAWEPFELQLDGRMNSPRIRFDSNFRSFILDQPIERKP